MGGRDAGRIDLRSDAFGRPQFLEANPLAGLHPFHSDLPLLATAVGGREAVLTADAAWLKPVLERCLDPDPARRFTAASDLSRALQSLRTSTVSLLRTAASLSPPVPREDDEGPVEGEVLGNYELVRLLGEGSMGRVFLARHVALGRQVALKVLKPEHARSRELVERFFQEARTVNRMNHAHIVEVFDFVEDRERHRAYCVMELLTGVSLRTLLGREALSVQRAVAIARQLCDALEVAHRVGVVHRDVKPDNVFITQDAARGDFVKVLDFGVAKLMPHLADAPVAGTIEGMIIGTPAYMSPEQASGLSVDHRTDTWALGAVLYEMLTGRVPFEGQAFGQLAAQILTQPPAPLPELSRSGDPIPPGLAELVLCCLSKRAEDRPPTMAALSAALEPFERGGAPVRRRRPRTGARVLAGAAAAAAALLLVGAAAIRPPPAPAATAPVAELRIESEP
ncbi:MAG: protein kinase domain-containing protein, partial [Myxococcales bacterium]